MVTSFYIMKMSKKRNFANMDEYYSSLQNKPCIESIINNKSKCRVCLQTGDLSIFEIEDHHDTLVALKLFGNVDVCESDKYSKYLCNVCYSFLKVAVLFRKIAIQTDEKLNKIISSPNDSKDDDFLDTVGKNHSNQNSDEEFSCINSSKEHIAKDTKVQCPTCKKTITKSYYKTHMTMHDPDHYNKYVCDICGKSFRLRVGYHNHRLRHRTEFLYNCHLCPFKGTYAERLKSHMRTHTNDYRYMCTECPARFLFKGNFNSHILLKHKEPQFKCDSCNKAFHTKLKLERHQSVDHLGIKSHVCNICGRAFGYRNAMMKHQRRVHNREKLKFRYSTLNNANQ